MHELWWQGLDKRGSRKQSPRSEEEGFPRVRQGQEILDDIT
jgi:hypothetical protein